MGHGKETPRQKMIGMMYLVLTALLALNVSAEVLNAFILVDTSLVQTSSNFQKKNEDVYTKFNVAMAENAAKVKEWKDKADEVKIKSEEMVKLLTDLKLEMVGKADGPQSPFLTSLNSADIAKKDENNIPSEIMILNKKGEELKGKIDQYRDFLLGLIKDKERYKPVVEGLSNTLNTNEIVNQEGVAIAWEEANFHHLPLAGAVTMLSKVQADIRNSEGDILTFLHGQIDAGSFKFNKIEAIVKAQSSYVLKGQPYEAEVFIAAADTSVTPKIIVGGSELKVKDGKGIYRGGTDAVGIKNWGGEIQLESPATGELLKFPFKATYEVGAPTLVVSPSKMNVFYIGVDNPIEISYAGVPDERLRPSVSGGKVQKGAGGWIVRIDGGTEATVSVSAALEGGEAKSLGSKKFRVKPVPDPVSKVMIGRNDEASPREAANKLAEGRVEAVLENFDFDLNFKVTGFTVSATVQGFVQDEKSTSGRLTSNQMGLIKRLPSGSKVTFEDVTAVGPDRRERKLNALVFRLK